MKIKSGDNVKVLSGKYRAKTGKVVQVLHNKSNGQAYVVVDGANMRKKHLRSGRRGDKGQVIELSAPMHISNVMVIEQSSSKPTRVGYKKDGDTKRRVSKMSGEFIS